MKEILKIKRWNVCSFVYETSGVFGISGKITRTYVTQRFIATLKRFYHKRNVKLLYNFNLELVEKI